MLIHSSFHFPHSNWIRENQSTQGEFDILYMCFLYVHFAWIFFTKLAVLALPNGGTTISREMYEKCEMPDANSTEISSEYSFDVFEAEKHDKTVIRRTRYITNTIFLMTCFES